MHTHTARVHENVYKPPQIKPRTYNIVHLEIHYRGTVCVDVERRYLTNARVVSLRKQTPETKALKPCQRCNDLAHWVPRGPMVSPTSFRDMRSICYQTQRGRSGKDKVPRLDISTTRRVPTPTDTWKEHLSNPCCFNQPRGHLSASAPRGCGAIAIYRFEIGLRGCNLPDDHYPTVLPRPLTLGIAGKRTAGAQRYSVAGSFVQSGTAAVLLLGKHDRGCGKVARR